jgi:hypothetical protein
VRRGATASGLSCALLDGSLEAAVDCADPLLGACVRARGVRACAEEREPRGAGADIVFHVEGRPVRLRGHAGASGSE